jgi:hypothetical protein
MEGDEAGSGEAGDVADPRTLKKSEGGNVGPLPLPSPLIQFEAL